MKRTIPIKILVFLCVVALLLFGGVWLLSRSNAESYLVGKVNDEGISRKAFTARVERVKRSYENQNGELVSEGGQAPETLNRIEEAVLNEMIVEKILLQEAKRAGFSTAPDDEVTRQLEEIKVVSGLAEPQLEELMGVKIEDLKSEISDKWTISQFMERELLKEKPEDQDAFLQNWLAGAMKKAKVQKFQISRWDPTAKASCCAPGGGCSAGKARAPESDIEKDAKAKGLEYYENKTHKKGAEARVTDFGCHIQVDILENGKVVQSLTYSQGVIQET